MRKSLILLSVVSSLTAAVVPACADERDDAAAAAMFGAFAGALMGSAMRPPVVYQPYPVYVAPPPVCWWEARTFFGPYGAYVQQVQVCR